MGDEEEDEYGDYSDSFEEYDEDDFEDYDEDEDEEKAEDSAQPLRPTIKIGVGEEEKYLRKLRRERWQALQESNSVQLEEVAIDNLFVMPPYSLSQLQQMGCGVFKTRLEKGTSGEAVESRRTQTDRVSTRNKHTQYPDPNASRNWKSAFTRAKVMKSRILSSKTGSKGPESTTTKILQSNTQKRLANFVVSSGRIIEKLLAENRHRNFQVLLEGKTTLERSYKRALDPSSDKENYGVNLRKGCALLRNLYAVDLPSHFKPNREVKSVSFSKDLPPLLAIALGPEEFGERGSQDRVAQSSLVSVWDLESMDKAIATCFSSGEIATACFGPSAQSSSSVFVLAGMEEGALCLWDCGEPENLHEKVEIRTDAGSLSVTARWPSYTTEAHAAMDLRLGAQEVVSVVCIPKPEGKKGSDFSDLATTGCQFRAISMNAVGVGVIWDVCDIPFANNLSQVSGTDLGLRIGSRYKLVKTAVIDVMNLMAETLGPLASVGGPGPEGGAMAGVTTFAASSDDLTTLAVGTSRGIVYRVNRFGTKPRPPCYFFPQSAEAERLARRRGMDPSSSPVSPVLSVAFSPRDPSLVLCAHLDGTVCLYRTKTSFPIKTWVWSSAIRQVAWHPETEDSFFALDAYSRLIQWSATGADDASIARDSMEGFGSAGRSKLVSQRPLGVHNLVLDRVGDQEESVCFATHFSVNFPDNNKGKAGALGNAFLCVTFSTGEAKVFILTK